MALWAGIDEAGYGPPLGPLVVAGTAFAVPGEPQEVVLWDVLRDAVARRVKGSDGRLVVNDSKQVYSPATGLRRLEEGVLGFVRAAVGSRVERAGELFALLEGGRSLRHPTPVWFRGAADLRLPVATNPSALESKASVLREALCRCGVSLVSMRAAAVFTAEFNRIVARTRNKSLLLFQKCGLILQELCQHGGSGRSHIVVDKHGGRTRYRRLLLDVFPDSQCDVLGEDADESVYCVTDAVRYGGSSGEAGRAASAAGGSVLIRFQEGADSRAFPAALASMVAKYVRELYMLAFNTYWQERLGGLRPTAGYHADARRFLQDIAPVLRAEGVSMSALVRDR